MITSTEQFYENSKRIVMRENVPALDGLRGMAILLVMISHFTSAEAFSSFLPNLFYDIAKAGWIGVDLFFVISGFLITLLLLDSKKEKHYYSHFFVRRALRIVPLSWLGIIVSYIVLPKLGIAQIANAAYDTTSVLALIWFGCNFVIASRGWIYHGVGFELGHYWSLAVEEQFYFIWPFIVFRTESQKLFNVCIAGILIAVVTRIVMLYMEAPVQAIYVLPFTRMDTLLMGALLAASSTNLTMLEKVYGKIKLAGLASAVAIFCIYLKQDCQLSYTPEIIIFGQLALSFVFASGIIVTLGANNRLSNLICVGPLVWLGKYSYGIYVFHLIVKAQMEREFPIEKLVHYTSRPVLAWLLYLTLGCAASSIFAWLSWQFYEKPFLTLRNRFNAEK